MGPLAFLLPLLASLPGAIGNYFSQRNEIQKAKLDGELQLQLANAQLAGEIAKAQLQASKEIIKATAPWFKYFTFFMWFGPFMINIVYPALGKQIFDNVAGMPEFYTKSCMMIMFAIWGISVSGPVVNNIFDGLGSFISGKRDFSLAKQELINKQHFYQALRIQKGSVSESDVKDLDPVIDKLNQQG